MKLINVGFSNLVSAERIIAIAAPDSAPLKRLIAEAREEARAVDCTCGKKNKSVIITDSDHIILSALSPEVIAARMEGRADADSDDTSEAAV